MISELFYLLWVTLMIFAMFMDTFFRRELSKSKPNEDIQKMLKKSQSRRIKRLQGTEKKYILAALWSLLPSCVVQQGRWVWKSKATTFMQILSKKLSLCYWQNHVLFQFFEYVLTMSLWKKRHGKHFWTKNT